jgi:hypothetical protein
VIGRPVHVPSWGPTHLEPAMIKTENEHDDDNDNDSEMRSPR